MRQGAMAADYFWCVSFMITPTNGTDNAKSGNQRSREVHVISMPLMTQYSCSTSIQLFGGLWLVSDAAWKHDLSGWSSIPVEMAENPRVTGTDRLVQVTEWNFVKSSELSVSQIWIIHFDVILTPSTKTSIRCRIGKWSVSSGCLGALNPFSTTMCVPRSVYVITGVT